MDAAILFSDILVVPQAMGIEIEMKEQVGPFLPHPIRSQADIEKVHIPDVSHALGYVMEGIRLTKERLADRVPLIGFAGAPWTIFCYAVEGKGSKNFDVAKSFAFSHPEWAHSLLQKISRPDGDGHLTPAGITTRSEERRVGKECRSRWSPYH